MYSLDKYKTAKNNMTDDVDNAKSLCMLAFIMLVVELSLLVYALSVAMSVTVSNSLERFVHIFFAFFLTIPYIFVTIIGKMIAKNNFTSGSARFGCCNK